MPLTDTDINPGQHNNHYSALSASLHLCVRNTHFRCFL